MPQTLSSRLRKSGASINGMCPFLLVEGDASHTHPAGAAVSHAMPTAWTAAEAATFRDDIWPKVPENSVGMSMELQAWVADALDALVHALTPSPDPTGATTAPPRSCALERPSCNSRLNALQKTFIDSLRCCLQTTASIHPPGDHGGSDHRGEARCNTPAAATNFRAALLGWTEAPSATPAAEPLPAGCPVATVPLTGRRSSNR